MVALVGLAAAMAACLSAATMIVALDEVPGRLALARGLEATRTSGHGPGTAAELKELTRDGLDDSVGATEGSNQVAGPFDASVTPGRFAMVGGTKLMPTMRLTHPDVLLHGVRIIEAIEGG